MEITYKATLPWDCDYNEILGPVGRGERIRSASKKRQGWLLVADKSGTLLVRGYQLYLLDMEIQGYKVWKAAIADKNGIDGYPPAAYCRGKQVYECYQGCKFRKQDTGEEIVIE